MKSKDSIVYTIIFIIGVIILLNILSDRFFFRLDFTADKRYTLSDATKDILRELEEPVTVKAYFSKDLPPDIAKTRRDFKEMLIEYSNRSRGNLVYEFINPNEDEEKGQDALRNGVQPVLINVRDKDQMKQQRAFLGAVVQKGEQQDVIPFIQPGAAMEYSLSSSIKKLTITNKPVIGFIQGHSEPGLNSLSQAMASLEVLYQLEPVTLTDTTSELENYQTVAIIAPNDSFSPFEFDQLDKFLEEGKNLLVALNRVEGNFQTVMGNAVNTGLETWLRNKGITVENNFVIDANCGNVTVQQPGFPFPIQMSFPYLPVISNFEEHPITQGLESVIFQFASSLTFNGDTNLYYTPIAKSSERSGTQSVPLRFNVQGEWTERDFPLKGVTVAAVLSGPIVGDLNSRLVVIGDGDFAISGGGRQTRQVQPDNISLLVNSIDWLSDDTGLIDLRTKGVTSRPLDQIEDSKKIFYKVLNLILPVILIIVYGIYRMLQNNKLRIKRMEVGYV
ncbi:GldG family protein [Bacteroidota bacterium]